MAFIRPSKRLGQNFLVDQRVLEREADYARAEGKSVLEVGAGTGNLTEKLAERAEKVVAVEKDERLIPALQERLQGFENVEIVCADFLEMNKNQLQGFDRIVSNVPYSISSPFLFKLLDIEFELAVLCLQKEFVERMVAKHGEKQRSRLSVTTQLQFEVEVLERVSRGAFRPVPKVDSKIILLKKRGVGIGEFAEKVILALFQHKNKKVANALIDSASVLGVTREELRSALKSAFNNERVFNLSNEQVLSLSDELEKQLKVKKCPE